MDRARALGITQPIVPGIMPITNFSQMKRMSEMCGAQFPKQLQENLLDVAGSPEEVRAVGIDHAIRQCLELVDRGAPGVHFYTLNRSPATARVLQALRETACRPDCAAQPAHS